MTVMLAILGGLMLTAYPPPAARGGASMTRWERSAEWKQFREYYRQIDALKTPRSVDALADQVAKWSPQLHQAFPERAQLVRDLLGVLHAKLAYRRHALRPARGERVPDRRAELSLPLTSLTHETGVLRGLRDLGGREPWIRKTLLPSMKEELTELEWRVKAPEVADVAAQAETVMREARAELQLYEKHDVN